MSEALAPKTRADQRHKQNKYKPRQYQRGRGGAAGGRGRGRGGRRPHLQSNSYRYEEGAESEEQNGGGVVDGTAPVSTESDPTAPSQLRVARPRPQEDDISSLIKDGFDRTEMNLLVLPDGSYLEDETLKQQDSSEEYGEDEYEEHDDEEEYDDGEEYADEDDTPAGLASKIKVDGEFKADEVDELDAFLAETSISSESRKYFKNPAGATRSATPQKGNDATQKWLDSVII